MLLGTWHQTSLIVCVSLVEVQAAEHDAALFSSPVAMYFNCCLKLPFKCMARFYNIPPRSWKPVCIRTQSVVVWYHVCVSGEIILDGRCAATHMVIFIWWWTGRTLWWLQFHLFETWFSSRCRFVSSDSMAQKKWNTHGIFNIMTGISDPSMTCCSLSTDTSSV